MANYTLIGLGIVLVLSCILGRKKITKFFADRDAQKFYYKDYGKGPFPTGRPRKERGH